MKSEDLKKAIEALCEARCFDEVSNEQRAALFEELHEAHKNYANDAANEAAA